MKKVYTLKISIIKTKKSKTNTPEWKYQAIDL